MLLNNKYQYNPQTDLIGTGGFGRVYKAKDTLLDEEVALKMVTVEGVNIQYSLIDEVKKAFKLTHDNILRYNDVFSLNGTTPTGEKTETQVGVMEYIPDGDISQLDWNALSIEQQKDIIIQILNGLEYLHEHKIIHRDIKPSNILIKKENGRIIPKITDFGISKNRGDNSANNSKVIGSIPYMSPEQFINEGSIDYNTDFWSLGILIYRLFMGIPPFGDESTTSEGVIIKNIMEMPLPEDITSVPAPFNALITQCLVKDRKKRTHLAALLLDGLNIDTGYSSQHDENTKVYNNISSDYRKKPVIKYAEIEGGYFFRGSFSGMLFGYGKDTQPLRKIWINDFTMSVFPVTISQYCTFLNFLKISQRDIESLINIDRQIILDKEGEFIPFNKSYGNFPVTNVTWKGADEFCKWVGGRLPTEAEWEYAAKMKHDTLYRGSNNINEVGWHKRNSSNRLHEVGLKKPNYLGLYDMTGNVWEWCHDWYLHNYYRKSEQDRNPFGPDTGNGKVLRGGAYNSDENKSTVFFRGYELPERSLTNIGFRITKPITS